jgi:hypothetical protein
VGAVRPPLRDHRGLPARLRRNHANSALPCVATRRAAYPGSGHRRASSAAFGRIVWRLSRVDSEARNADLDFGRWDIRAAEALRSPRPDEQHRLVAISGPRSACRGLVALPGGVQALSARSLSRPLPGGVGHGLEQLVIHRDSGELVLAEDQERHVRDGEDGSGVAFPVERGQPVGYWPTPTTMATPCPFDGPQPVREDWVELPAVVLRSLTMTTLPGWHHELIGRFADEAQLLLVGRRNNWTWARLNELCRLSL